MSATGSVEKGLWGSRPALTVWSYATSRAAAAGTLRLAELVRGGSVAVIDALTAMWVPGSHRPWLGQLRQPGADPTGAYGSALVGLARELLDTDRSDERLSRVAGALGGIGVGVEFIREAHALMAPPRSTLMVLSSGADLDAVRPVVERGLARGDVVLLHALLRTDALVVLREALDETGLRDGTARPAATPRTSERDDSEDRP